MLPTPSPSRGRSARRSCRSSGYRATRATLCTTLTCTWAVCVQLSDSSNDDSYFADPSAEKPPKPLRAADEQGYIIRQSVLEEGTQPDYVIPVGSADGTWGMMKKVAGFRAEGWLALWKGAYLRTILRTSAC
ncbi:hypothetical protein NUW54_g14074 [Trametes sanguinea]|uniref:Uncharacterized protein n=1 Tax=Trametes sanguinea TaxID=158606 RepID=A0ACC1MFK7_9APHY|nr:hypothetical protein NUW54_g14074 [Trametes sanguinea]